MKYVAATDACPSADAVEQSAAAHLAHNEEITSVDFTARVPFAARARVCWYRVAYSDVPSAETGRSLAEVYQESRDVACPSRERWQDFEATRARYLTEHSGERRMTCPQQPKPEPESLGYCLEQNGFEGRATFHCVEHAFIEAQRQDFHLPCKNAGEELPSGTRVVELAAEDELPDMAACFYRVEYDVEVSSELGSIGYGPR